jgi:hypothetical protein
VTPVLTESVTLRQLPPEEWPRLLAFEPFTSTGLPSPDHWRVIVAERAGVIVAFNCLFEAIHMEPLWVAPEYRGRPHEFYELLTRLWGATKSVLQDAQVPYVFACVNDESLPRVHDFVRHLGYIPADGKLYVVPIDGVRLGGS